MLDLAVVVPTYNEQLNVGPLVDRLEPLLAGLTWEVVFVDDDSPDGTADGLRLAAQRKPHVRCLQRIGRWVPARFVLFSLVGASGVRVHFAVLWLMFRRLGWVGGLLSFHAICGFGAVANVGVASAAVTWRRR